MGDAVAAMFAEPRPASAAAGDAPIGRAFTTRTRARSPTGFTSRGLRGRASGAGRLLLKDERGRVGRAPRAAEARAPAARAPARHPGHGGGDARRDYAPAKAERAGLDYDDLIDRTGSLLRAGRRRLGALQARRRHRPYPGRRGAGHQPRTMGDRRGAGRRVLRRRRRARAVDRTIFAVGDEKQSIFSFQGAEPAEFAAHAPAFRSAERGGLARVRATVELIIPSARPSDVYRRSTRSSPVPKTPGPVLRGSRQVKPDAPDGSGPASRSGRRSCRSRPRRSRPGTRPSTRRRRGPRPSVAVARLIARAVRL